MPTAKSKRKTPNTLSSFKSAHDKNVIIPSKIRAAFATMLKESPEAWRYEGEMITLAGISTTEMGAFRSQFEDHIVDTKGGVKKRVWFADSKVAAKARG